MASYPLPNDPSLTSPDHLRISSIDCRARVSHYKLLTELIQKADEDLAHLEETDDTDSWTKRLEKLLEMIAYALHGQYITPVGIHLAFIDGIHLARRGTSVNDRRAFHTHLFRSALQLDTLFPSASLLQLSEDHVSAAFSPQEMDCLLAHMFLGTLHYPEGNTRGRPGFTQYYDKVATVVPNTAIPYLETIVSHFIDGGYAANMDPQHRFTFTYSSATSMPDITSCDQPAPKLPVTLVEKPSDPSKKKDAFVLVAANAEPGPGAGGTHEERLVGQSPALAIVSLLTPVLAPDAAVITSPLPVHSTWEGHGRESKMLSLLPPTGRPTRSYIIADAITFDLSHREPHLLEKNVNREVRKLYAAFNGAQQFRQADEEFVIEMPPWGCGAFGGSLKVKMPCMIMAAGLAGLTSENLELLVPRDRKHDLWVSPRGELTVADLYVRVVGRTASTFDYIKSIFFKSN